jgi:hypothetical protein
MKQRELAKALGISAPMVTKLKARGMPTSAVDEASAWRDRHIDPALVKTMRRPDLVEVDQTRAVDRANDLGRRADQALGRGSWRAFVRHIEQLRAEFRTLAPKDEERVQLSLDVWDALCGVPGPWTAHAKAVN